MQVKDIGEIGLIKRMARKIHLDKTVIKGIGDDTAVIRWTRDKYLLFTCDMLVENVHFSTVGGSAKGGKLKKATPFEIGWKALCRNVSDIAAMGGVGHHAVVSVGIRANLSLNFIDGIYKGLREAARRFRINIVGGDTSSSENLVIDVSLIGEVEKANLVTRNGARRGDLIMVTGSIGGSIKGKHLNFLPRVNEARQLVKNFKINSMIDISDGLVLDLWRILDASSTGAAIYENAVPLSRDADSFKRAVYDGEDFELLFTMSAPEARRFFKTFLPKIETPIALIGEIMDKRYGYKLIDKYGKEKALKPKGYLHF